MKYTDEGCFFFDIALVNGIGIQLEPFKYTGKKIILYSIYKKIVSEEIKRV